MDCSLFYLALRKKTVLQGLWRTAGWNREQVATQRLLANNFEEPKWRTAALKNAYALMSKRRFGRQPLSINARRTSWLTLSLIEYAAAFFLLADHLQDAVNVCLGQLKDLQLAVTIARVYEGDTGPVLRRLLEDEVLSLAAQEGNRWLASWAFWMLHRRDMAVRALIVGCDLRLAGTWLTCVSSPCYPDSGLHTVGDAVLPRHQVEAVPDGRPRTCDSVLTATCQNAANVARCFQGDSAGGVGVRAAQCQTLRPNGL